MRLVLINPPLTVPQRYGLEIGDIAGRQMPLGIYYIAEFLKRHGYRCDVIDAEYYNLGCGDILSELGRSNPAAVGVTSSTASIDNAINLCGLIKKANPEVKIIIGGPHVSALPVETMKEGAFDIGVIGEGELTVLELMEAMKKNAPLDGIDGIIYRGRGELIINKPREYIKDLDILPHPARYDFKERRYRPPLGTYRHVPVYNIMTSRGCPYTCVFCSKSVFGSTYRAHSPGYVVSEIEELAGRHKAREIAILDDDFVLDKDRVYSIIGLLKKRNIRIAWSCMERPDIANIELLRPMKAAGCWHVSIGIESGNVDLLGTIGKRTSVEGVRAFVKAAKTIGLKIKGFLVLGLSGESEKSIDETISFVKDIRIDDICATIATPIPGSPLYQESECPDVHAERRWQRYTCWEVVRRPSGPPPDLIYNAQYRLYKEFYSRPRIIFGHVKNIKNFYTLKRYASSLFAVTSSLKKAKHRL